MILDSHKIKRTLARINEARSIINFTFAGRLDLDARLRIRSQPNRRLVEAFGINNSFTTTSVKTHILFLKMASASISTSKWKWQPLFDQARHLLKHEISECGAYSDGRVGLASCVRHLSLRIVLSVIFKIDPLEPSKVHISAITEEINDQWIRSKTSNQILKSKALFASLNSLNLGLSSDDVAMPPEMALGIILPAFETLWRVVLLTFVTAFHRQYNHSIEERLKDIPACLGDSSSEKESLKVAKEGLRLYPSTKRVYRTDSTSFRELNVAADVEWCHRSDEIWGPDSLSFRPDRFDHLSALQKNSYFPFGLQPHVCPAVGGFGERLITMLVAALGQELSHTVGSIRFNDADLDGRAQLPLPTGRGDMEKWALFLKPH
ncbi:hypothetical protein GQ53DRAFT_872331 [Thozetella sp. PMI_491]|nr:hypothetical protein GQ53DRAFT_872331 [Thozetella sp. PMI_491]